MPRSARAPRPRKGHGHGELNPECQVATARVAAPRLRPPARRSGCFRGRGDTLVLGLEPRVIMARVDHERTRLYDFRCITWNPACLIWGDPNEIRDEAMKHTQEKLES